MKGLISTATEQDIPALNALVNGAYRGESSRKGLDYRSRPTGWHPNGR